MTARQNFRKEWEHFCSKIKFGDPPLDARALIFMNEIEGHLNEIEDEAKKGVEK